MTESRFVITAPNEPVLGERMGPKSLDPNGRHPKSRNMEVLVLGRPGLERSNLDRWLVDTGHEVSVCHDGGWACVGMDGPCPLDQRTVDMAIVHADASDRFDPHGIACTHRAGVALITVGATPNDPVLGYATLAVDRADDELSKAIETIRISRRAPRRTS